MFTVELPSTASFDFEQYDNGNWKVTAVYGDNRTLAIQSLPDSHLDSVVRMIIGEGVSEKNLKKFSNKLRKQFRLKK